MSWNSKEGTKSYSATKDRAHTSHTLSRQLSNINFSNEKYQFSTPHLIKDGSTSILARSPFKKKNVSSITLLPYKPIGFKLESLSQNIYKMRFVYNKIKEDQFKLQTEFWQFMNQLNQVEITRNRIALNTDRQKSSTPEKDNKLKNDIENIKKFYEKICEDKDRKYLELKSAFDAKSQEVQECYQQIDLKRNELKTQELLLHKLEKSQDEATRRLRKEIERLEMEKSSLENHYVSQINSLRVSKDEAKSALLGKFQVDKDLSKNKGSSGVQRSQSRDKILGGQLKFEVKTLLEDKEYYQTECEVQRKNVEALKKDKDQLVQLTIQAQQEIIKLEADNKSLINQIDSLNSQNQQLQTRIEELNNRKTTEEQYIDDYIEKRTSKPTVTPLKLNKIAPNDRYLKDNYNLYDLQRSKRDNILEGTQSVPTSFREFSSVDKKGSFSDSKSTLSRYGLPTTKDKDFQLRLHNLEKGKSQELLSKIAILEEQNSSLYFKAQMKEKEIADLRREMGLLKEKLKKERSSGASTARNADSYEKQQQDIELASLRKEVESLKREASVIHSHLSTKYSARNRESQNQLIIEPHEEVSFFNVTDSSFEKISRDKHDLQIKELEYKLKFSEEERQRLERTLLSKIQPGSEPVSLANCSKEELLRIIYVRQDKINSLKKTVQQLLRHFYDEVIIMFSGKFRKIAESITKDEGKISKITKILAQFQSSRRTPTKSQPPPMEDLIKQLGKRFEESQKKIQQISDINQSMKIELEDLESPQRKPITEEDQNSSATEESIDVEYQTQAYLQIEIQQLQSTIMQEQAKSQLLKEENDLLKREKESRAEFEKFQKLKDNKLKDSTTTSEVFVQEIKTLRDILSHKDDIILALQASERHLEEKVVTQENMIHDLESNIQGKNK